MRIKRVEGGSVAEALRELRRELGDHALILHTKHLPPKGLTGWFKTPRVEILGAIDEPDLLGAGGRTAQAATGASTPTTAPAAGFTTHAPGQPARRERVSPGASGSTAASTNARAITPAQTPGAPGVKQPKRIGRKSSKAAPGSAPVVAEVDDVLAGISFGVAEWAASGRRARRIALVGPTGAGKTTTLAKLAAKAHLEQGRRVGLITIDTYRIGAVPQLAAYADILGVPLEVASTPDELSHALARLDDRELIFIDTIGRSPMGGGVDGLVPFLAVAGADEVHLVLSATTRAQDSEKAARSFARLVPNRLIVTKIDETDDHSAVAAACRVTGLPLTWLGTGQEVPDDLEPATPGRLATLLTAGCVA